MTDEGGVRGILARPFSGHIDGEFFPTLWDKAAALLHGFATTQYFEDGNKRTAWVISQTFLRLNGVRPLPVAPIHSEVLMLATAANALEVSHISEWLFSESGVRFDDVYDGRVEFMFLAAGAEHDESGATLSAWGLGLAGYVLPDFDGTAVTLRLAVCTRIHWTTEDDGVDHEVTARIVEHVEQAGTETILASNSYSQMPVIQSGHQYQKSERIPALVRMYLEPEFVKVGSYEVQLLIDGELAATKTFAFNAWESQDLDGPIGE
ncbi:type II toxin-antitoxin system death-on-curing family toxin [Curtobacterium sp. ISL-83]|uniref:type II toxin-antitoxin system death-on-curing family toxin n=1 Tax=Curtobacterium sp. ISL-83 TaxID=2819145 RepID=UPI001BEC8FF1|nr:Fic family protein [Curtobacterium sp. ISL-83]